jgi:hypothetical protein
MLRKQFKNLKRQEMNIKYLVLFIYLMTISIIGFSQNRIDSTDNKPIKPSQLGIYENTSLIKLIAAPENIGFSQNRIDSTDNRPIKPSQLGIYENTSLIKLIATPEKYDGKTIQVIGFLHLEFEGKAIYLHKEDYENSLTDNSFWVRFSKKLTKEKSIMDYNDKYVIIIGTFKMNDKGHMGLFGGTLENIVRLDTWGEWGTKK